MGSTIVLELPQEAVVFLLLLTSVSVVLAFFNVGAGVFKVASKVLLCLVAFLLFLLLFFKNESEVKIFVNKPVKTSEISKNRGKDPFIVIEQDDPKLVPYVRSQFLLPPSKKPYNLKEPDKETSMGQGQVIRKILKDQRNGFFIECGALDGETRSNTLTLERDFGWNGLLIEGDPGSHESVINKHRKAWFAPACISTEPRTMKVRYGSWWNIGKIASTDMDYKAQSKDVKDAICIPFIGFMRALNVTTVDYFSLDVEGNEFDVLKTIPFNEIDIRTLSVEFVHGKEPKTAMPEFMKKKGYVIHSKVTNPQGLANDYIFVKKELMPEQG